MGREIELSHHQSFLAHNYVYYSRFIFFCWGMNELSQHALDASLSKDTLTLTSATAGSCMQSTLNWCILVTHRHKLLLSTQLLVYGCTIACVLCCVAHMNLYIHHEEYHAKINTKSTYDSDNRDYCVCRCTSKMPM